MTSQSPTKVMQGRAPESDGTLERPGRDRLVRLVEHLLVGNSIVRAVSPDDGLTEIGLSSIDMVNLMLAVEAEFDIMIPQSDITPENFHSISTIEALVEKLRPRATGP